MSMDRLEWVTPVRSGNVFEETIEHVVRLLRLGQFPPGSKLPAERELAEAMGVSRTTLREALGELQQAGYLEIKRGRYGGSWVAEVLPARKPARQDPAHIEDVLTLRAIVEPAAASLAATRRHSKDTIDRLGEAERAVAGASPDRYRPLDARLHLMIADLSGSPSLAAVVADVRTKVDALLDQIPLIDVNLQHSSDQHEQLVGAILAGEATRAEALARDHIGGTAFLLRGFLG